MQIKDIIKIQAGATQNQIDLYNLVKDVKVKDKSPNKRSR